MIHVFEIQKDLTKNWNIVKIVKNFVKVGRQDCSPRLVTGRQGWSPKLVLKVGWQGWTSSLVVMVGRQGRSSSFVVKVGRQDACYKICLALCHNFRWPRKVLKTRTIEKKYPSFLKPNCRKLQDDSKNVSLKIGSRGPKKLGPFFSLFFMRKRHSSGQKWFLRP